jgi:tripartite-type tricarboxylate transporter receptor subunit TctC
VVKRKGRATAARRPLLLATLLAAATAFPAVAQQAYPSRTIRIISPFAAGGGNDIICRTVAAKLTENFKQQVIVENRTGANGIIGTEFTARAAPDGYTIALIPSGHAVNAALYSKLPFDSVRDFTMISLAGSSPLVLAVHPSVPARSVKELAALAKARPGQLSYVSAGVGASGHLGGALFEVLTGTKMTHVPYKGMSLALTDLVSGQVTMAFATSLSVIPHLQSRRLRGLATTGAERSPALPELPTVAEAVPGYEASLWYGFAGPARLPADIVRRLNTEIVQALKQNDVRERLAGLGVDVRSSTPEELTRLLATDMDRWARVVQRTGIRVD